MDIKKKEQHKATALIILKIHAITSVPELTLERRKKLIGVTLRHRWSLQSPVMAGIMRCHTSLSAPVIGSWGKPGWLAGSHMVPLHPPRVHSKHHHAKFTAGLISVNLMLRVPLTRWKSSSVEATSIIPPLVQENAFLPERSCMVPPAWPSPCSVCQGSSIPRQRRSCANKLSPCANDLLVNFSIYTKHNRGIYSSGDYTAAQVWKTSKWVVVIKVVDHIDEAPVATRDFSLFSIGWNYYLKKISERILTNWLN